MLDIEDYKLEVNNLINENPDEEPDLDYLLDGLTTNDNDVIAWAEGNKWAYYQDSEDGNTTVLSILAEHCIRDFYEKLSEHYQEVKDEWDSLDGEDYLIELGWDDDELIHEVEEYAEEQEIEVYDSALVIIGEWLEMERSDSYPIPIENDEIAEEIYIHLWES